MKKLFAFGCSTQRVLITFSALFARFSVFSLKKHRFTEGFSDWGHAGVCRHQHEISQAHLAMMHKFRTVYRRLNSDQGIDQISEVLTTLEVQYWRDISKG